MGVCKIMRIGNSIKFIDTYGIPMSLPSMAVLWTVQDNPGLTQYRISRKTGYSNQRCHQIIAELAELELLIKDHQEYSNKSIIRISEKGHLVLEEIYKISFGKLSETLSHEEMSLVTEAAVSLDNLINLMNTNNSFAKLMK